MATGTPPGAGAATRERRRTVRILIETGSPAGPPRYRAAIGRIVSAVKLCVALLLGTGLVSAALSTTASGRSASRAVDVAVPAPSLGGEMRAAILLPPGYSTSGKRYPVIYFLHGLPASPFAYRGIGFLDRALAQLGAEAILVAPQAARDGDGDGEYLNWGSGRNWETALSRDLPRYVDSTDRMIADLGVDERSSGFRPAGTAQCSSPCTISGTSPLSNHGVATSTRPTRERARSISARRRANARASAHALVSTLRADLRRRPTFLAFYVGSGDARFLAENREYDAELRAAHIAHLFRVYPGRACELGLGGSRGRMARPCPRAAERGCLTAVRPGRAQPARRPAARRTAPR